jgi:hypothetical protein
MQLLNPGIDSDSLAKANALSGRLPTLESARIVLLDNRHHNVAAGWERLADLLEKKFGAQVVAVQKANANTPAGDAIVESVVSQADAVINGIGDCGSCTSWSVHDGTELERRGTPTVTVITEAFRLPGALRRKSLGFPDLALVEMKHPLASMSVPEVHAEMDRIFVSLVEALVIPS